MDFSAYRYVAVAFGVVILLADAVLLLAVVRQYRRRASRRMASER